MKTMALIGLILVATVSPGVAADTLMTIQTNTTVKIDPITGLVKGDAQTQVRGIQKHHEAPEAVNTSATGTSAAKTGAATTPVALKTPTDSSTAPTPVAPVTPTDPNTASKPVSADAPTGLDSGTAPVGAAPPGAPCPVCPFHPVVSGPQN